MRTARIIFAATFAALALPAAAGSWPNLPVIKPATKTPSTWTAVPPQSPAGFVEEAGDAVSSLEQYRYFRGEEVRGNKPFAKATAPLEPQRNLSGGGFEFIGGEGGWNLSQHKYVLVAGKLAHSQECDHAIRTVKAPTPEELEATKKVSPGA